MLVGFGNMWILCDNIFMKHKLSILMPTYNDADSIVETLDSVIIQSNNSWELIIINDGGVDDTDNLVSEYIKKHSLEDNVKIIRQKNKDQLRAIMHGMQYVTGDIVTILHSDDLFYDSSVVEKILKLDFNNYDGFFCDLFIIDENSQPSGFQRFNEFYADNYTLVKTLLMYGRQQYADFFIAKRDFFISQIKDSYLTWNLPFYISMSNDKKPIANIKKTDFFDRKYRVHEGNYINNEIGKLNVINGEIRTAVRLMRLFEIPAYKIQAFMYRIFKKLGLRYPVLYHSKKTTSPDKVIKTILNQRFRRCYWQKNIFLRSIYYFYRNYHDRQIKITVPKEEFVYLGCDMRRFNNDILKDSLSEFYQEILNEMQTGFSSIVCSRNDEKKVNDLVKFLCIDGFVKIVVE